MLKKIMREDMAAAHEEEDKQSTEEVLTNESNLHQAINQISSLILLSCSIKVFHGKWQAIRSKLKELNSGLTAAKICHSGENVAFSELVLAILVTVNECNELAVQCIDFSYGGKLLMQSNLNVISAKFEVHLKRLAGYYNAGILTHGYAIVVSRPSFGASCDDMKFYVKDLLTRMKAGGVKMKRQALLALNEVVVGDKNYVKIVVEVDELLNVLVNFIGYQDMEIQEKSMNVITVIAESDSYKGFLVGAGIIVPLIQVLVSGSDSVKEKAARCMQKLTENSDNVWSISSHGGIPTLLKICANGDSKPELLCSVGGVLKNLAGVEEIKRFMVEEGAILDYVKLLKLNDEMVQIHAIAFLQIMVIGDEGVLQVFIKEGGIQSLVSILEPRLYLSTKSRKMALEAIEDICFSFKSCMNILKGCRFLNKLLFFLCNSELLLQESALRAVLHLCRISEETKKAMGDEGFMSVLLALLNAKCFQIQEMASEALSSMLQVPRNRRRFMEEDCGANRILEMLDPNEEKLGNTRFLLSSLTSLSRSNSGRRKIAVSSHLVNLEKLAEAEVVEAKKIIRKISSNRFRNILESIWST